MPGSRRRVAAFVAGPALAMQYLYSTFLGNIHPATKWYKDAIEARGYDRCNNTYRVIPEF